MALQNLASISFQVSTTGSAYSLGLAEMFTGSTSQVLQTFKQVLSDIELVAGSGAGDNILARIKNTMSDRHIVEKNFNILLEDYRSDILPKVIESWEQMTPEEKLSVSTLNNFFCGLHLLVGMADVAASTLLEWESTYFEGPVGAAALPRNFCSKSESGIV